MKESLRSSTLDQRNALSVPVREARSRRIHERLYSFPPFLQARSAALFASIGSEVLTDPVADFLLRRNVRVCYPRVMGTDLELFWILNPATDLTVRGRYRIPEPDPTVAQPALPGDLDFIAVPGVAFDPFGGRIGYGKGFYDRLLIQVPDGTPVWGLAFELQMHPRIPTTERDIPVTGVITEERIYQSRTTTVITRSPEETEALGGRLGRFLKDRGPGTRVVALTGELGMGKTCCVRGMARETGSVGPVTSPTFTLVNEYPGAVPLHHLDLYRLLEAPGRVDSGMWDEILTVRGIVAVEWADRWPDRLPLDAIRVDLGYRSEGERSITVTTTDAEHLSLHDSLGDGGGDSC